MRHVGLQLLGALAGAGYLLWFVGLAPSSALFAPSLLQRAGALGTGLLLVVPWAVLLTRLGLAEPEAGSTLARLRAARRVLAIVGGVLALVPQIVAGAGTASVPPMTAAFPVWVALLPLLAYLPGGALYVLDALYVGQHLNAASVQSQEAAIIPR